MLALQKNTATLLVTLTLITDVHFVNFATAASPARAGTETLGTFSGIAKFAQQLLPASAGDAVASAAAMRAPVEFPGMAIQGTKDAVEAAKAAN